MGLFRNRGPDILPAIADNEGRISRVIEEGREWMDRADDSNLDEGYNLAETAANLLEAGELAPMHVPPSQRVAVLRGEKGDVRATRVLLEEFVAMLEPYRLAEED